jgi:hypothetical protein
LHIHWPGSNIAAKKKSKGPAIFEGIGTPTKFRLINYNGQVPVTTDQVVATTPIVAPTAVGGKDTIISRMSKHAKSAVAQSGQEVSRVMKSKEFRFINELECEQYIHKLWEAQSGLCAITGS